MHVGSIVTLFLKCPQPDLQNLKILKRTLKDIPALPTNQVDRKIQKSVLKIWKLRKLSHLTSIYTSCSSLFIFTSVNIYFLRWKIMKSLIWLTFLQNAAVFKVFKNNETVDCRQTFLNCFWNSNLRWKQFFRSSSNLNQALSIIIQQF